MKLKRRTFTLWPKRKFKTTSGSFISPPLAAENVTDADNEPYGLSPPRISGSRTPKLAETCGRFSIQDPLCR
ncbi:MAG: hypothetical protein OXE82_14190 [Rhodobacter sp.]|nr:hypothetical protein [Rhodobacter sp.]